MVYISTHQGRQHMNIKIWNIFLALFLLYSLAWNIVRFIYFVKCLKITECSNEKCKYKHFCSKYQDMITDEEIEELLKLLDQFKSGTNCPERTIGFDEKKRRSHKNRTSRAKEKSG